MEQTKLIYAGNERSKSINNSPCSFSAHLSLRPPPALLFFPDHHHPYTPAASTYPTWLSARRPRNNSPRLRQPTSALQ